MINSNENMDLQQTSRPHVDLAAVQNAASVKAAGQTKAPLTGFPATINGPPDGPARFQQPQPQLQQAQFPAPRSAYGPVQLGQRAPVPRHAFFGRPPQPGQGSRFPPPRPPPAGYGAPQGFPLGRPAFPSIGGLHRSDSLGAPIPLTEPRFFRPQQPQPQSDRQALLRAQASIDGMMTEQARLVSTFADRTQLDEQFKRDKIDLNESSASANANANDEDDNKPTEASSRDQSATEAQSKSKIEYSRRDSASLDACPLTPKTSSNDSCGGQGFDEGRNKSLSSPTPRQPRSVEPQQAITTTSINDNNYNSKDNNDAIQYPNGTTLNADEAQTCGTVKRATPDSAKPRLIKKSPSIRTFKQDAENDSGVDETTQRREAPKSNGISSRTPSKTRDADKRSMVGSPVKSPNKSIKSLPRTPDAVPPPTAEKKKVPMNKVQVGAAPSPNLKAVRSKIGSLENATHKPGGGKIKIENRKLDFSSAQPKIAAKNDKYIPSGGDKKIEQVKLQWNAKPKIGSLDNATYKPGGGNKKIESVKLDFKDRAKSKVGSKENAKHMPGGGSVKIESQKLEFKAESKVGSMDNVKHRPGGGDKKIFDDKSYLRQAPSNVGSVSGSGSQSPIPMSTIDNSTKNDLPNLDGNFSRES